MRVTVPAGEDRDSVDCPHQFVGRCDECSGRMGRVEADFRRDEGVEA